jgi:hypothetical protein
MQGDGTKTIAVPLSHARASFTTSANSGANAGEACAT